MSSTHAVTLNGSRVVSFRGATFVPEQRGLCNVGPVPCRPRSCNRTYGGAAKCMVKVHRYSELQRSARSFRAERLQLRICSEVVSISARSALIGLVESRAFCGPQALASCVFNVCCERYLCRCTGVGYGTPAQERHAFFCPFHTLQKYETVSWNDVRHFKRTRSNQKPCDLKQGEFIQ